MASNQIALFDMADKRLAWVDKRQELLSQNIANADTPGWRPRDVTSFAAQLSQAGVTPARTNPMHLAGGGNAAQFGGQVVSEQAPDGNAVAMDVELGKIADTETTHDLVDDLYTKYLAMFRIAIGR